MERFVIVPRDADRGIVREFCRRLEDLVPQINARNLASIIPAAAFEFVSQRPSMEESANGEFLLWGRSAPGYMVSWTSGERPDEVVQRATAMEPRGLIAEVFETARDRDAAEPVLDAAEWTNLGELRGKRIVSMCGAPIVLFDTCVGVLSWSQYDSAPRGAANAGQVAALFSGLAELRIFKAYFGMEPEP